MNRGLYEQRLVQSSLPTMPEVVEVLQRGGSALDIGCGTGIEAIPTLAFGKADLR